MVPDSLMIDSNIYRGINDWDADIYIHLYFEYGKILSNILKIGKINIILHHSQGIMSQRDIRNKHFR